MLSFIVGADFEFERGLFEGPRFRLELVLGYCRGRRMSFIVSREAGCGQDAERCSKKKSGVVTHSEYPQVASDPW